MSSWTPHPLSKDIRHISSIFFPSVLENHLSQLSPTQGFGVPVCSPSSPHLPFSLLASPCTSSGGKNRLIMLLAQRSRNCPSVHSCSLDHSWEQILDSQLCCLRDSHFFKLSILPSQICLPECVIHPRTPVRTYFWFWYCAFGASIHRKDSVTAMDSSPWLEQIFDCCLSKWRCWF